MYLCKVNFRNIVKCSSHSLKSTLLCGLSRKGLYDDMNYTLVDC